MLRADLYLNLLLREAPCAVVGVGDRQPELRADASQRIALRGKSPCIVVGKPLRAERKPSALSSPTEAAQVAVEIVAVIKGVGEVTWVCPPKVGKLVAGKGMLKPVCPVAASSSTPAAVHTAPAPSTSEVPDPK